MTKSDTELPVHPAAMLFPLMSEAAFRDFVDDIRKNGICEPIALLPDGSLIDGRHRLRACREIGIDPKFVTVNPDSPTAFVISKNKHRRHLTSAQLAALSVEDLPAFKEQAKERMIEAGRDGGRTSGRGRTNRGPENVQDPYGSSDSGESRDGRKYGEAHAKAAQAYGTNPNYVRSAEQIKRDAPDVFEKLKAGEVSMPAAVAETAKRTGKRAQIIENAAKQRANEFIGRIAGVAGVCETVSVDAIRSDERLRRLWLEECEFAMRAIRDLLKRLRE